jgi:hypothetical protein
MLITHDEDYIRVIDGAFDLDLCSAACDRFEQDSARHTEIGDRCIELDLFGSARRSRWTPGAQSRETAWRPFADQVVATLTSAVTLYRTRWDPLLMMPDSWALEGLRVKCYRPGVHEFRLHVDQANRASSTRFLACLIYLNSNEAGTEFPQFGLTVAAKAGRILLFPPTWQYPHRGLMPTTDTKYIASTYLHYKD